MANLSLWSSLTAPSLLPLDSQSCLYPFHVPTPPNSREFRISAAKSGISSFIPAVEIHLEARTRAPWNFSSASGKARSPDLKEVGKKCQTCGGQGAIECRGCKGTGKNKKNGNIFERWKCFDCQGFGLKSCPSCGKGGLTPEQRGER